MNTRSTRLAQRASQSILVVFAVTNCFSLFATVNGQDTDNWIWNAPKTVEIPGVTHQTIQSPSMKRTVGYNIYLPPQYRAESERRFPVVYFLHGAGGTESSDAGFARLVDAEIKAKRIAPCIYVFPNGGKRSGYRDWKDRGVKSETLIMKELIPHVDANFRTINDGRRRAICGFSMGGGGALRLALKYPDQFCAAAALAAAFDADANGHDGDNVYTHAKQNQKMIRNSLALSLVVGSKDGLQKRHPAFLSLLEDLEIKHSFQQLEDVGHNLGLYTKHSGADMIRFISGRCDVDFSNATESNSESENDTSLLWKDSAAGKMVRDSKQDTAKGNSTKAERDRVGFPNDYSKTYTVLRSIYKPGDRQFVTVYGNQRAASVSELSQVPYPYGSVIVMEKAAAVKDAHGKPVLDADNKARKGDVQGLHVMRREEGFGEMYGENRTGQWEYVEYRADGSYITPPSKSQVCADCHRKAGAERDWVFLARFSETSRQTTAKQNGGLQEGLSDFETTQRQDKELHDASEIKLGDAAPDIELTSIEAGRPAAAIKLSSLYQEKPLVIFMGSCTCNLTRDRAPRMNKLYEEYKDRANFAFVYMKEAHPTPSVTANVGGKKVRLAQPQTADHRLALARHLIDKTQLALPVFVDDMSGTARKAFASYHLAAYVINTHGEMCLLKRYQYKVSDVKNALDGVLKAMEETSKTK